MKEELEKYIVELEKEAERHVKHTGSLVTSMAEDHEINEIGKEQMKIVNKLKEILLT